MYIKVEGKDFSSSETFLSRFIILLFKDRMLSLMFFFSLIKLKWSMQWKMLWFVLFWATKTPRRSYTNLNVNFKHWYFVSLMMLAFPSKSLGTYFRLEHIGSYPGIMYYVLIKVLSSLRRKLLYSDCLKILIYLIQIIIERRFLILS